MAEKARRNDLIFRPHFKTHQSVDVGNWFREAGVEKITVSSVKMASYFANDGWKDIFIAFPVNLLEAGEIDRLAGGSRLTLSVESPDVARRLAGRLTNSVGVSIKIDTGYHRTGLDPGDTAVIDQVLEEIGATGKLEFTGFYTHAGHTYMAKDRNEIERIHLRSRDLLTGLGQRYRKDFHRLVISVGDTPSCSLVRDFDGIDEIRPGNFVFYDLMQQALGACSIDEIAVVLECPVVAKHAGRMELLVHGGAVNLSKESMHFGDRRIYGLVVTLSEKGWSPPWENTSVVSLSQEHGIIKTDRGHFDSVRIGDTLGILPVHSCLTANLAEEYVTEPDQFLSKTRS